MKSIKYFFILLAAVIVTGACNKKLDVLPQQNITPGQITTGADVEAVLFGGYKLLQSPSAFGEQYILVADLLASQDQVNWVGTFTTYKDIQNKVQDQTNGIPATMWENSYTLINVANTVLNKIDLISEDEKDAITGEAEFIRGITYFELVNFFSKPYSAGDISSNPGVPVLLEPIFNYDAGQDKPARATVEAVYNQIIADLTDAAAKLPETADNGRATKYAAEAFLSRVYMNRGDYANAATMANDVIESKNYALAATFNQTFNNDGYSSEDILGILQSSQSNAGTADNGLTTFYSPQPAGRGDAQVASGFSSHFTGNDFRGNFIYPGISIAGFSGDYTGKWSDFYKTIPVIRLAEMYLTRGEANLRSGTQIGNSTPLKDINMVRQRSNASTLSSVTGDDFVEERFRELSFEGDRLWTLKRLQLNVDGLPFDADKLVLPIPQRETDVNANLVQNPGY